MTQEKTELDRLMERFDELYPLQVWSENNPEQAIYITPVLQKIHKEKIAEFIRKEIEELVKKLIGREREIDDGYLDGMYHEQTHGYNEKRQEIIANAKSLGIDLD